MRGEPLDKELTFPWGMGSEEIFGVTLDIAVEGLVEELALSGVSNSSVWDATDPPRSEIKSSSALTDGGEGGGVELGVNNPEVPLFVGEDSKSMEGFLDRVEGVSEVGRLRLFANPRS